MHPTQYVENRRFTTNHIQEQNVAAVPQHQHQYRRNTARPQECLGRPSQSVPRKPGYIPTCLPERAESKSQRSYPKTSSPASHDPDMDNLLTLLECLRFRYMPYTKAPPGTGVHIPSKDKPDSAIFTARLVDLAISRSDQGMYSALTDLQRACFFKRDTDALRSHGQARRAPEGQAFPEKDKKDGGRKDQRRTSKKKRRRKRGHGALEEGKEGLTGFECEAGPPSPALDIPEASALLLRTAAAARDTEAAACLTLLAGISVPSEHRAVSSERRAGGAGPYSSTEDDDSAASTSDQEEFEIFMSATLRANGGTGTGRGWGKELEIPRFHDDPTWYFVHCAVPWTSKVGIAVVNTAVVVKGRPRQSLTVSTAAEDGSGYHAGVREGDCVVKVEGRDATSMPCSELMRTVRELIEDRRETDPTLTIEFIFARKLLKRCDGRRSKVDSPLPSNSAVAEQTSSSTSVACTGTCAINSGGHADAHDVVLKTLEGDHNCEMDTNDGGRNKDAEVGYSLDACKRSTDVSSKSMNGCSDTKDISHEGNSASIAVVCGVVDGHGPSQPLLTVSGGERADVVDGTLSEACDGARTPLCGNEHEKDGGSERDRACTSKVSAAGLIGTPSEEQICAP